MKVSKPLSPRRIPSTPLPVRHDGMAFEAMLRCDKFRAGRVEAGSFATDVRCQHSVRFSPDSDGIVASH